MLDQPRGGEEKSSQLSLLEMKSFDFRYPFARSDLLNNNHEVSCLSGLALKLASFEQEGINQCPSILDAFNHELPDPNQELFLQFDPMFTCFERLPIEIRKQPVPIGADEIRGCLLDMLYVLTQPQVARFGSYASLAPAESIYLIHATI